MRPNSLEGLLTESGKVLLAVGLSGVGLVLSIKAIQQATGAEIVTARPIEEHGERGVILKGDTAYYKSKHPAPKPLPLEP